jgi:hypothetical protein
MTSFRNKPKVRIKTLSIKMLYNKYSIQRYINSVTTLALGSRPSQKGCKVTGQEEGSPGVKAKALQGCGPRGNWGVTSHTPESVRKCEGV